MPKKPSKTPRSSTLKKAGRVARPLTIREKKDNHKNAETNRRLRIRDELIQMALLLPGTKGKATNEMAILSRYLKYSQQLIEERKSLIADLTARGWVADPQYIIEW